MERKETGDSIMTQKTNDRKQPRKKIYSRKRIVDRIVYDLLTMAVIITILPFILIIINVFQKGYSAISLGFLLETPSRGGTGGGIVNAITGSLLMVAIATGMALPLSLGGGIFIAEYIRVGRFRTLIETTSDLLAGIPSIVYGAFGFTFFVSYLDLPISAVVGGLTLGLMMIPTILRTTQEAILAIPRDLREASFALGATKITTTFKVTIRAAFPAITTGILLALGRALGETAPLLFTAGYSIFIPRSPWDWAASMPFIIFKFWSESFRPGVIEKAYGTALVLMLIVFIIDVVANYITVKITRKMM